MNCASSSQKTTGRHLALRVFFRTTSLDSGTLHGVVPVLELCVFSGPELLVLCALLHRVNGGRVYTPGPLGFLIRCKASNPVRLAPRLDSQVHRIDGQSLRLRTSAQSSAA